MTSSTDILLCIGYFVVWILTFIWYHIKRPQLDAGSVIIGMQVVYAFFSILTISNALFSYAFNELKLFPYIYLYSMLMVALLPVTGRRRTCALLPSSRMVLSLSSGQLLSTLMETTIFTSRSLS